jgi:hypothetical protein
MLGFPQSLHNGWPREDKRAAQTSQDSGAAASSRRGEVMKSQLMEERIRRITVLFSELSFRVIEDERSHNAYSATFEDDDAFQAGVLIERGSRFFELAYALTFPTSYAQLMKGKLEEMLKICYEFGCYVSLQQTATEISYSVFTKIYYSGLNYYSLRDSLRDFRECVAALMDLLEIGKEAPETPA